MKRPILAAAFAIAVLMPAAVHAQAPARHCRSFIDRWTRIDIAPLTTRGVDCRTASSLASMTVSSFPYIGKLVGQPEGSSGWVNWNHPLQVMRTHPASQSILVTFNRGGGETMRPRMSWAGAGRRGRPVVLLGSLIAVLVCALAVAGTTAAARTNSKQPRVVPSDPARLALLNSSFPRVVRAGQVINYTLRLANVGNAPALRVRLCDRPPLGVVVTLAPRFARVGRLFCTTIPVLRTLGHRTFHLRARARLVARGIVVNRAVATAGNARLVRSRARTLVVAPAPLVTG